MFVYTGTKKNKADEANTINQHHHLMVENSIYHCDNKGSKILYGAVKHLVIPPCDDRLHWCLIV